MYEVLLLSLQCWLLNILNYIANVGIAKFHYLSHTQNERMHSIPSKVSRIAQHNLYSIRLFHAQTTNYDSSYLTFFS